MAWASAVEIKKDRNCIEYILTVTEALTNLFQLHHYQHRSIKRYCTGYYDTITIVATKLVCYLLKVVT